MTMGTAELLRLPEVQACIKTDFLLLPCDLVCEIPGESLTDAWMVTQSALGGSTIPESRNADGPVTPGQGGEQGGRRGGLAVYYQTRDREESVKGEGTDFVVIAPLEKDEAPAVSHTVDGPSAVRFGLSKLVMSSPMDTVEEKMAQDKGLLVRHSLVEKHAQTKILTTFRDAHLYIFPYWVKDLARHEKLQSVSEDLIGYWAKAEWQRGLADKLGMARIFHPDSHHSDENASLDGEQLEEQIDLQGMSTTKSGSASRDQADVPPILAYVQRGSSPFVRRVDSSAILLSTSLRLAKLESVEEVGRIAASPFAHNQKIAHPAGVAQRCTVTKADCLLAENVTVEEKCVIKESVIGAGCHISSGARLTRCLIMDGAVVGERCQLTGCIVGRRSKIGRESVLKDCEVQDGNVVPEDTDAKNEKFMIFEGFDDDGDDLDASGGFDDQDEDDL